MIKSTIIGVVSALAIGAAALSVPWGALAGSSQPPFCFGRSGVQEGTHDAYECSFKDADEGGTLYWQLNNTDVEYNLHPDSGNYVVQAVRTRYYYPYSTNTGFTTLVMSMHGGCLVVDSGYDQHPTECQPALADGSYGTPRPMTTAEQASYNDFAEVMGEGIPDGYWSH